MLGRVGASVAGRQLRACFVRGQQTALKIYWHPENESRTRRKKLCAVSIAVVWNCLPAVLRVSLLTYFAPDGVRSIAISVFVCLSPCLSVGIVKRLRSLWVSLQWVACCGRS